RCCRGRVAWSVLPKERPTCRDPSTHSVAAIPGSGLVILTRGLLKEMARILRVSDSCSGSCLMQSDRTVCPLCFESRLGGRRGRQDASLPAGLYNNRDECLGGWVAGVVLFHLSSPLRDCAAGSPKRAVPRRTHVRSPRIAARTTHPP